MERIQTGDSIEEIITRKAVVAKIERLPVYEGPGEVDLVFVDGGEYPISEGHSIKPGMLVEIIPHIDRHESGGSITTFEIREVSDSQS